MSINNNYDLDVVSKKLNVNNKSVKKELRLYNKKIEL